MGRVGEVGILKSYLYYTYSHLYLSQADQQRSNITYRVETKAGVRFTSEE